MSEEDRIERCSAASEPVAWLCEYDGHTDATTDPDTVRIWTETLKRTVTPLHSALPQTALDREAVAKIIDPAPWGSPWSYPHDWEGPEDVEAARQRAFAKADAILALSRPK